MQFLSLYRVVETLTEVYLIYEEISRFIQRVLRSTHLHANKSTKDCCQFLIEYLPNIQKTIEIWTRVSNVLAGRKVSFNKLFIFSSLERCIKAESVNSFVEVIYTPLSANLNVATASNARKQTCEVVWVINFVTGQRITAPSWKQKHKYDNRIHFVTGKSITALTLKPERWYIVKFTLCYRTTHHNSKLKKTQKYQMVWIIDIGQI